MATLLNDTSITSLIKLLMTCLFSRFQHDSQATTGPFAKTGNWIFTLLPPADRLKTAISCEIMKSTRSEIAYVPRWRKFLQFRLHQGWPETIGDLFRAEFRTKRLAGK